jgi:hypothetical protein
MEAQGAELSGYAERFRCFLERRVLKQFVLVLKNAKMLRCGPRRETVGFFLSS